MSEQSDKIFAVQLLLHHSQKKSREQLMACRMCIFCICLFVLHNLIVKRVLLKFCVC